MLVEVKSVTLCTAQGYGLFPDAVSERGRKHLVELQAAAKEHDTRAVMLFCALHNGIESVSCAGQIDPRYRIALQDAQAAGVEVLAWRAQISPHFIYNALGTIASFVRTDPDRARELVLEFADFTRYSFRNAGEFTVLADELRNIDRYLTLERARFGDSFL